jgi:hypothetical protein
VICALAADSEKFRPQISLPVGRKTQSNHVILEIPTQSQDHVSGSRWNSHAANHDLVKAEKCQFCWPADDCLGPVAEHVSINLFDNALLAGVGAVSTLIWGRVAQVCRAWKARRRSRRKPLPPTAHEFRMAIESNFVHPIYDHVDMGRPRR